MSVSTSAIVAVNLQEIEEVSLGVKEFLNSLAMHDQNNSGTLLQIVFDVGTVLGGASKEIKGLRELVVAKDETILSKDTNLYDLRRASDKNTSSNAQTLAAKDQALAAKDQLIATYMATIDDLRRELAEFKAKATADTKAAIADSTKAAAKANKTPRVCSKCQQNFKTSFTGQNPVCFTCYTKEKEAAGKAATQ